VQKLRIMIVGAGDVAQRLVASSVGSRARWFAVARSDDTVKALRVKGILAVPGDLDHRASLRRAAALARSASSTLYLAPPPNLGSDDPRVKRWLAQSSRHVRLLNIGYQPSKKKLQRRKLRNVYVSTTGVYGDRAGDFVQETTAVRPQSARAKRRVAAETRVRRSKRFRGVRLRAPGIYAAERLPIERLRERVPALHASEDVFTNHIHADDLARAVWLSMFRARPGRVLNVVDDASLKMGEYFDAVADSLGLPRAPRVTRGELAQHVTPMMMSFMNESRRIDNARMKRELRIRLQYPTPQTMLATMKTEAALQRSLL
jgi:nucleoside-diphosphate-sugar epimerase